jgi:hypothetical protein
LGNAARQLLALTDREQRDPRLLALIAQKDPVYLARLLTAANGRSAAAEGAHTVDEAIRALGVNEAYALMRTSAARQYLLMLSVSLSLTTRRLSALLRMSAQAAMDATLAAFLDILGVYALLVHEHAHRATLETELLGLAAQRAPLPREAPWLAGYTAVSVQLAQRWGARPAVAATVQAVVGSLQAPASMETRVLALAHELVAAKLANTAPESASFASSLLLEPVLAEHAGSGRALELAFLGF